jgi:hypothetical protein
MGLGSEAVLYDIDGSPLAIDNGVPIPIDTPLLMIGGSDGTNSRYIKLDSSGNQILVGAGTAGSPVGGIITIQGTIGGTNVPISGNVDISNFGIVVSTNNSTTTPLGAAGEFIGTAESVLSYQEIDINLAGGPSNATGTLYFEFSPDGTNWDVSVPLSVTNLSTVVPQFLRIVLPWFRVRYVNGANVQSTFRLTTIFHRTGAARLTRFLNQSIDNSEPVENVRAVIAGAKFTDSSMFINKQIDEHVIDTANKTLSPLSNGSVTAFTVDAGTDVFTSNSHGLVDGDAVNLTTTGTLPAPLTTSTTGSASLVTTETIYWIINSTTNTFKLSTSSGGSAVNVTDTGTGTHSFQKRGQFTGTFKDVSQIGSLYTLVASNVKPAIARLEWSDNGTTQNNDLLASSSIPLHLLAVDSVGSLWAGSLALNTMNAKYYRARVVNGSSNQAPGISGIIPFINRDSFHGTFSTLDSNLSLFSLAQLTRSVFAGVTPDGYFKNAKIQGTHTNNSSFTALPGNSGGSDHIFIGEWVHWQEDYTGLLVDISSDVTGTLRVEFSQTIDPIDGNDTSLTDYIEIPYDPILTPLMRRHITVQSKWVRIKYINGVAAQSRFSLDTAFVIHAALEPKIPINRLPEARALANIAQTVTLAEREEASEEFVKVKTTRNSSNKDGLNTNITGIEDDIAIKPLSAAQARQFTIGATAVQIDTPTLSTPGKRRVLGIQTKGSSWTAYGFNNSITFTGNAMMLPPNSFKSISLDEGVNIWAITEQTGGSQTTFNLNGASATGTATNPTNALTSNDTRASISANSQNIRVTGLAYTPTVGSSIQSVKIGCEARKQPGQETTVTHVATVTQASADGPGNVGLITSSTVTGGATRLILVAITRENPSANVTSVTNTGTALTWTKLQDITAASTRRLDVWWARGNPGATFTVTANFSQTADNCHIAVSTYDGTGTSPISASGTNTGNGTSVLGPSLTGANRYLSYLAVVKSSATSTPGASYVERSDEATGTGSNRDGLTTLTRDLTTGGSEQATATLSFGVDWGAIGVIVSNSPATDPIITISYETPNGVAGVTTSNFTFSAETDESQFLTITGDRSWTESDVDNIVLIATGQSISTAACEVDRLWLEVIDTTGNTTRISVEQYAGSA